MDRQPGAPPGQADLPGDNVDALLDSYLSEYAFVPPGAQQHPSHFLVPSVSRHPPSSSGLPAPASDFSPLRGAPDRLQDHADLLGSPLAALDATLAAVPLSAFLATSDTPAAVSQQFMASSSADMLKLEQATQPLEAPGPMMGSIFRQPSLGDYFAGEVPMDVMHQDVMYTGAASCQTSGYAVLPPPAATDSALPPSLRLGSSSAALLPLPPSASATGSAASLLQMMQAMQNVARKQSPLRIKGAAGRNRAGGGAPPALIRANFARAMSTTRSVDDFNGGGGGGGGGGSATDGDVETATAGGGRSVRTATDARDRNRAAQRRFRERQRARVETLESRCAGLAGDVGKLEEEVTSLKSLNTMLERVLTLREEHIVTLTDAASGAFPDIVSDSSRQQKLAEALAPQADLQAAHLKEEEARRALIQAAASGGNLATLMAAPALKVQRMASELSTSMSPTTSAGQRSAPSTDVSDTMATDSVPQADAWAGSISATVLSSSLLTSSAVAATSAPPCAAGSSVLDHGPDTSGGGSRTSSPAVAPVAASGASAAPPPPPPQGAAPPGPDASLGSQLSNGMALLLSVTPDIAKRLTVSEVVSMWRDVTLSLKGLVYELDVQPDMSAASPQLMAALLQHVQLLGKLCGVVAPVTPQNMLALIAADMSDLRGQPAAPGLSTPQHWAGVVSRLQLGQEQVRDMVAARERLLSRVKPLLSERQEMGLQLAQTAPSSADYRGLSLNTIECHSLAARLKDNLTAEHLASMEFNFFVFKQVFSLVGIARAAVYSYPLFPDALAIANVVAEAAAEAAAVAAPATNHSGVSAAAAPSTSSPSS